MKSPSITLEPSVTTLGKVISPRASSLPSISEFFVVVEVGSRIKTANTRENSLQEQQVSTKVTEVTEVDEVTDTTGDCEIPLEVEMDIVSETMNTSAPVDTKEVASSPNTKQVISLDRHSGYFMVHVYHEDDGSSSAEGSAGKDSELPFFPVSNRKGSVRLPKLNTNMYNVFA
ncbi:unnamed protein product [Eruca vesicaria subsp. sativa]|uniref:Uncharacterized protein n=1 Tax=Eruca vesicaria subsp. sativa TaxID=29727 RepID=A0ABC8K445_ERUVS|nr:unnamed protein product [Eruca vesicaria subsp. sativa]